MPDIFTVEVGDLRGHIAPWCLFRRKKPEKVHFLPVKYLRNGGESSKNNQGSFESPFPELSNGEGFIS